MDLKKWSEVEFETNESV